MLRQLLRTYWPFIVFFVLFLSLFAWIEEKSSREFGKCINEWAADDTANKPKQEGLIISKLVGLHALCVAKSVDRHNGFFSAFASFIVALFTYTLYTTTNKLWLSEERNFRVSQRAFVFIDSFNFEITTALDSNALVDLQYIPDRYHNDLGIYITRFAAQPRWKNGGSTPTRMMNIQVGWRGPVGQMPPDYVYKNGSEPFFLAPMSVEASGIVEMSGAQALVDYHLHYQGVEPNMFIWGRADYEDIFGNPHFVQWCYKLRLERHTGEKVRASFIQWGDYNRTDQSA